MEYLDYYDEKQNYLGRETRKNIHENALWHKTVHCWLYDEEGNVYFQIRKDENKFYTTASGHVVAGEDVKEAFVTKLDEIKELINNFDWELSKADLEEKVNDVKAKLNEMVQRLDEAKETLKDQAELVQDDLEENFTIVIDAVKDNAKDLVDGVKTVVSSVSDDAKVVASSVAEEVKIVATDVVDIATKTEENQGE